MTEGPGSSVGGDSRVVRGAGAGLGLGTSASVVAAITLMAASGWLLVQNRTLKVEVAQLRSRSQVAFDIGTRAPEIILVDDAGRRLQLRDLDETPTVFAFLTTECPFCLESVPVWKDLASAAERMGKRFIGVSFDSPEVTREWAERWEVDFELWHPASTEDVVALGVSSVPITVAMVGGRVHLSISGSLRGRPVHQPLLSALRD